MGILSGYVGGWVDQIIMRVTDAWLALPAIVFAIFLAAMVGPSMWDLGAILGGVHWRRAARALRAPRGGGAWRGTPVGSRGGWCWPGWAGVIRGEVLTLRERDFVKLAEIAGASR